MLRQALAAHNDIQAEERHQVSTSLPFACRKWAGEVAAGWGPTSRVGILTSTSQEKVTAASKSGATNLLSLLSEFVKKVAARVPPPSWGFIPDQQVSGVAKELEGHPDKAFSHHLLQGLEYGFRMGLEYTSNPFLLKCNMLSATQHQEVVRTTLGRNLHWTG